MMDPQALDVVNEVIEKSPKPETEEGVLAWKHHMAFLKRRKAYILIDKNRLAEAEKLLMEMTNDSLCKDFAEGELKYMIGNIDILVKELCKLPKEFGWVEF